MDADTARSATAMRDCALDVITACVRHDAATASSAMALLQRYLLTVKVPDVKTQGAITDMAEALALFRAASAAYNAYREVADAG